MTSGVDVRVNGARTDPLSWSAITSSRDRAFVLAGDSHRGHDRESGRSDWRVAGRRLPIDVEQTDVTDQSQTITSYHS